MTATLTFPDSKYETIKVLVEDYDFSEKYAAFISNELTGQTIPVSEFNEIHKNVEIHDTLDMMIKEGEVEISCNTKGEIVFYPSKNKTKPKPKQSG